MTTSVADRSVASFLVAGTERTGEVLGGLREAWDNYLAYRATLAHLRDLTERQLHDVGLTRADLKPVARTAVYGN